MHNLLFNEPLPEAVSAAYSKMEGSTEPVLNAACAATVAKIVHELPSRSGVYAVNTPEGPMDCFFVLDELGGRMGMASKMEGEDGVDEEEGANMNVAPFVNLVTGLAFSIIW
jgi:hypothetical protein